MADYHFVSTWRIHAPIEQVWQEILHAERWPTWWEYVVRVDTLESGAEDGVGKRLRLLFRTLLPYTLGFDIRLTEVQPPSMLASEVTGELEGTGRWLLTPEDGGTLVRYNWDVQTTRWWMNLLARSLGRRSTGTTTSSCSRAAGAWLAVSVWNSNYQTKNANRPERHGGPFRPHPS